MALAFIFPGQGSQAVGMGRALSETFGPARRVFEEVDDALSRKLSRLMFEGPESELVLTENAQPALMAVSLAVLRALESEGAWVLPGKAQFVAGHSLGEYSALAAAGSLSLSDTARLLSLRGKAMQQAVPVGEGAMAALLGLDLDDAVAIAAEAGRQTGLVCAAANDNAPGQVVVSGARAAIERAIELAGAKGARRSVLLPVSAPFHCPLMQPAADAMAVALGKSAIGMPAVPLIANVTAQPVSNPDTIRDLLVKQVTATVRWRESVLAMKATGVDRMIELGSGKVLAGLVKRIDREVVTLSVGSPDDLAAALKVIG
jgi:[acyl-carrier-protein] S-malonyltransferase